MGLPHTLNVSWFRPEAETAGCELQQPEEGAQPGPQADNEDRAAGAGRELVPQPPPGDPEEHQRDQYISEWNCRNTLARTGQVRPSFSTEVDNGRSLMGFRKINCPGKASILFLEN